MSFKIKVKNAYKLFDNLRNEYFLIYPDGDSFSFISWLNSEYRIELTYDHNIAWEDEFFTFPSEEDYFFYS